MLSQLYHHDNRSVLTKMDMYILCIPYPITMKTRKGQTNNTTPICTVNEFFLSEPWPCPGSLTLQHNMYYLNDLDHIIVRFHS